MRIPVISLEVFQSNLLIQIRYSEPQELDVGDAMIYDGVRCEHWRDEFKGDNQYQVFMHYVDAHGKYKDLKYDGRDKLGIIMT